MKVWIVQHTGYPCDSVEMVVVIAETESEAVDAAHKVGISETEFTCREVVAADAIGTTVVAHADSNC